MDLLEYLSQQIKQAPPGHRRSSYRYDLIKALINSYPAGTPIRPREISVALGYRPQASSVFTLINTMLKNGEISRQALPGQRGHTYTVLVPSNTYDKERQELDLKQEGYVNPAQVHAQRLRRAKEAEMLDKEEAAEEPGVRSYTFKELESLALRNQLYNPDSTVGQFLKYIRES